MAALGGGSCGGFVEAVAEPGSFPVTYSFDGAVLQLSWDEVPGAVGYAVYAGNSPGSLQPVGEIAMPGFSVGGLNGSEVFFQVLARMSSRAGIAAMYADGAGGGFYGGFGHALLPAGVFLLIDPSRFLLIDDAGHRLRIS